MIRSIKNFPFFYGWIIVAASTIGILMSIPGQTIGVSLFTEHLIESLAISRTRISFAYMIGTIGSALTLTRVGILYDRYGVRPIAIAASLGLALVLFGMTFTPAIKEWVTGTFGIDGNIVSFVLMMVGFFLMRLQGQGALTLVSRNMMTQWFVTKRGLVNAIMGTAISFGFNIAPLFIAHLIDSYSWRGAWRVIAGILTIFAVFVFFVYRHKPEQHGLTPDGTLKSARREKSSKNIDSLHDYTLRQAISTYPFWICTFAIALYALFLTALTFHVVSIFESVQMTQTDAVSIFLPFALISIIVQVGGSLLCDHIKLKYLYIVHMIGIITAAIGLFMLAPTGTVWILIIGAGISGGTFGILNTVTWPRFYGRGHLGAISGFSTAIIVIGTALGPVIFSAIRDIADNYRIPALICLGLGILVLIGTLIVRRPSYNGRHTPPNSLKS